MRGWVDRFWAKVDKSSECWLWTGAINGDGYGYLSRDRKPALAHRLSWELHRGQDAGDMLVCHRCDVRHCVNPDHLFLGTTQENTADRNAKGRTARGPEMQSRRRHARGDANGSRRHPDRLKRGDAHYYRTNPEKVPRGERHNMAILDDGKVREIRRRARTGERKRDLAVEFGVKEATIYDICSGRSWSHIPLDGV